MEIRGVNEVCLCSVNLLFLFLGGELSMFLDLFKVRA